MNKKEYTDFKGNAYGKKRIMRLAVRALKNAEKYGKAPIK